MITIGAEDRHYFKDRLSEITAPTLVVAGARDPFYEESSTAPQGSRRDE